MGWMPIQTAPTDGTVVDLWCGERLADCRWREWDTGWEQRYAETSDCFFGVHGEPTHWMPLPQPPHSLEGD